MSPPARRRYQLRRDDLNQKIEELLESASRDDSAAADLEFARQILVTGVHMLRDRTSRAELKLVNSALKELRHAFRVFEPYTDLRKVAVFGSARTSESHGDWIQARAFAEAIVRAGWMVITGAGDGIMGAAQGGAGACTQSFGVNIRLPFEQIGERDDRGRSRSCINFRYFFTRKVIFVKESHADRTLPRRLRNPRRGLRGAYADPDRQERDPSGRLHRRARRLTYWKDMARVRAHAPARTRQLIEPGRHPPLQGHRRRRRARCTEIRELLFATTTRAATSTAGSCCGSTCHRPTSSSSP